MTHALTAINHTGQPAFGVLPDDNRLKHTLIHDVQHHRLADRQVDTLIVKRVALSVTRCRFSGSNIRTLVLPLAPYASIEFLAIFHFTFFCSTC
jgi:hypothetical protein